MYIDCENITDISNSCYNARVWCISDDPLKPESNNVVTILQYGLAEVDKRYIQIQKYYFLCHAYVEHIFSQLKIMELHKW